MLPNRQLLLRVIHISEEGNQYTATTYQCVSKAWSRHGSMSRRAGSAVMFMLTTFSR